VASLAGIAIIQEDVWMGILVIIIFGTLSLIFLKSILIVSSSIREKKYRVQQLEEEQSEIEQLKARITDLENKEDSNQKPQEESQGNTERIVKVEKAVKRGFIMSSLCSSLNSLSHSIYSEMMLNGND
tara:strand:- start:108 stop:491 length:384 start_codon:yes stop_codon:yes gene_type:complete